MLKTEREERAMREKGYWKRWFQAAGIRAVKTMAQTAVALLPAAITITAVDWPVVIGTAALSGVSSLLTSLKGLPELESK